jgi:hypothetical protein
MGQWSFGHDALSFAFALDTFILVASPQCKDEKYVVDALWIFLPSQG